MAGGSIVHSDHMLPCHVAMLRSEQRLFSMNAGLHKHNGQTTLKVTCSSLLFKKSVICYTLTMSPSDIFVLCIVTVFNLLFFICLAVMKIGFLMGI